MDHAGSAFIRRTYAHFASTGVPLDGVADGEEYTRNCNEPVWEQPPSSADAPEHADSFPKPLQERLACVDRYGFFDGSAGSRMAQNVLPRAAYLKGRSVRRVGETCTLRAVDPEPTLEARGRNTAARAREIHRIEKWAHMLVSHAAVHGTNPSENEQIGSGDQYRLTAPPTQLQRRVYKGVPDRWRAAAWAALAAEHSKSDQVAAAKSCDTLQLQPSEHDVQIDLDVPRTMRGHVQFHTRYGGGQRGLFSVLHAASLMCSECGYCQGMGPLAAMLLCYLAPTDAYALLVQLHDDYHFHDFFRPGFPGLREMFYVQQRLTNAFLPNLDSAMRANGVVPSAYATSWYMTLFSNTLPFATQLRVWDALLLDGRDVLLYVALAILHALAPRTSKENAADWLLEALSAPQLPEDDDALMRWVQSALHDRRARAVVEEARRDWSALSQTEQESLFL